MPVFMKVWAGSWLIASVTIERMMQMSSATVARCGKIVLISWPLAAAALKRVLGSEADQLLPLELGDRHAAGERLGHRLAVHLGQGRLVVERLQVRRAAGHVQVDDPLDLGGEVQRVDRPGPAAGLSRGAAGRVRVGPAQQARVEQRGQGQGADPRGRPAQERAALDTSRRGIVVGLVHGSAPGDGFVQVQEHAGHGRPGRQLGRIDVGG